MSATSIGWRLRGLLGPGARRGARRVVDLSAAWALGSVVGARTTLQEVSLTFDDGPDPHVTPQVLDALDRVGARATFFVLSDQVRRHPALVRSIVGAGHEVGLHGDNHDRLTLLPPQIMATRLAVAADTVQHETGVPLRWFRPPFGAQDRAVQRAVRGLGMESVVWGPTAYDWEEGTPSEVAARGLADLSPGAVLLLHDGLVVPAGHTPPTFDRGEAHALLLQRLTEQGWTGRSVGGLVALHRPRRTVWFRP